MKKNGNQRLVQALLSLFLAVIVWAFAIHELNPIRTLNYSAIPVQFSGLDALEAQGLTLLTGGDSTMRVYVEGNATTFSKLDPRSITITTDLSEYTAPGEYQLSGSAIRVSVPVDGLKVSSYAPRALDIVIDRVISRDYPINAHVTGSPAVGYRHRATELSADTMTITGPETLLDQIASVVVSVEANALYESMVYTAPLTLMTAEQNVFESELLTLSRNSVDVTVRIDKEGKLPLRVDLLPSDTLMAEDVTVEIEPKSVDVHADSTVLKNYDGLTLAQIDLSEINLSGSYTFPITIPNRLTVIGETPETAQVTVTVREQTTQPFTITEFALNDVADQPAEVELLTESIEVTVTGLKRFVETLTAEDITVSLSYDSSALGAGEHELYAQVAVKQDGNYELTSDTAALRLVLTPPAVSAEGETGETSPENGEEPA